jgi:hypothetical protein
MEPRQPDDQVIAVEAIVKEDTALCGVPMQGR